MEKNEYLNEFEETKAQYRSSSSANQRMATVAKVLTDPKLIIETGIDAYRDSLQHQLDQALYQHIVKDKALIKDEILQTGLLNSTNAFSLLQQRIEDPELSADMRMHYVSTLAQVSGHFFQGMAKEVNTFQTMAVDLNKNQAILLENMKDEFTKAAMHFTAIESHLYQHDIKLLEIGKQFRQITTDLSSKVSGIQRSIGKIEIQEKVMLKHQERILGQVNDVHSMLAALFTAHADVDIKDFEKEPDIKALHQKLHELYQLQTTGKNVTQDILKTSDALKCKKAQIQAKRENFSQRVKDAAHAVSGISNVASLLGHAEIAVQVETIGQATLTVAENVAGLMGIGVLAATINPLTAFISIGDAIAKVVNLFGRKKNASSNPHAPILEAIRALSKQINQLREQMNVLFDQVFETLGRNQRELLINFAQVHYAQAQTTQILRSLYLTVQMGFAQQSDALSGILQGISQLQDQLQQAPYHADLKELTKILRFIKERGSHNYVKTSNTLEEIGLNQAIHQQIHDPMQLIKVQNPTDYFHATQYYYKLVKELLNIESNSLNTLANPIVLSYACCINIMLALQEYPEPSAQNSRERIASKDIQCLQQYEFMLSQWLSFIMQSRDEKLMLHLVEDYLQAAANLNQSLKEKIDAIEDQLTQDRKLQLEQRLSNQHSQAIQLFNQQEIKLQTYNLWFTGIQLHDRRWHEGAGGRTMGGKKGEWRVEITRSDHTDEAAINQYLAENKRQIDEQKKAHQQRINQLSLHNKPHLSTFNAINFGSFHGVSFIVPEDAQLPILPAPTQLLPETHPDFELISYLFAVQALGKGYIHLTYTIENKKFVLNIKFNLFQDKTQQTLSFAKISLDYEPLFYEGAEAVWWYWMGGNLIVDSKFDATIRQLSHWQGGHKGGEHDIKTLNYRQPQARVTYQGMYQKLNQSQFALTLQIEDVNALILISTQLMKEHQAFAQQVAEQLVKDIELSHHSAFGKVCYHFEKAYRNLYGLLCHAYHDTMQNPSSPLARWFLKHPTNLSQIKRLLCSKENIIDICQAIDGLIAESYELSSLIEELNSDLLTKANLIDAFDFSLVSATQIMLESFILRYEPYAVITNKNNVAAKDREIISEAQYEALVAMTSALLQNVEPSLAVPIIKKTITNFNERLQAAGPAAHEEVMQRLKEHFKQQGLKLPWDAAETEKESKSLPKTQDTSLVKNTQFFHSAPSLAKSPTNPKSSKIKEIASLSTSNELPALKSATYSNSSNSISAANSSPEFKASAVNQDDSAIITSIQNLIQQANSTILKDNLVQLEFNDIDVISNFQEKLLAIGIGDIDKLNEVRGFTISENNTFILTLTHNEYDAFKQAEENFPIQKQQTSNCLVM